jgi:hypothetical protein
MENSLHSEVLAIAKQIHTACASFAGGSAGNCQNATLALALALGPTNEPVAICQGQVVVDGVEHDHYWCRIGHTIVDPTADQFAGHQAPLIELETSLTHYRETSFFVFTPRAVLSLLQAVRPNNAFKPTR